MPTTSDSPAPQPLNRQTALLMAAGRFECGVAAGAEPEPGARVWEELRFVAKLLPRLDLAYRDLGYDIDLAENPVRREVAQAVDDALTGRRRVLHLISHGSTSLTDLGRSRAAADPEQLCFVPACGDAGFGTDVVQWVRSAHRLPEPTLFVVDLCRAGRAARIAHLTHVPDDELNAWVIAATSPQDPTYDGAFSEAVCEVLEEVARNGLDTDPSIEFVRWDRLVKAVQQRLTASGSGLKIHTTRVDTSQELPVLPFFRNPNWSADLRRTRLQAVAPPVRAFVADFGADHFIDRVGDHFVGRRGHLTVLAPWLDDAAVGGLVVVTGAPGSGKSALLGALVCAGHPDIVEAAPDIRAHLVAQCAEGTPSTNVWLAAIHARGGDLDSITASLTAQWRLPASGEPLTPARLVEAVCALDEVPALVFDALDEAEDPDRLVRKLLLPLVRTRRPDGEPACRVLVGTRRGHAAAPLFPAAGTVVDLDLVPVAELRADLRQHLLRALDDMPAYRAPAQRPVRSELATTVADALTEVPERIREWGPFLVARIFARSLEAIEPATDPDTARRLGAAVPRDLPGVLELDLSLHPDGRALRAVLAATAWARGQGFPTEAVTAVAPLFDPSVTDANVRGLLNAGRFYLRTTIEVDGSMLYRLFHQGLADYLKSGPLEGAGHDDEDPWPARHRELPAERDT